jgi:uncharacterized protein (DUF1778 family)
VAEHARDRYVIFRVTPQERRAIREAAEEAGETMSDHVRKKVLGWATTSRSASTAR